MAEGADFTVTLNDKFSGPAKNIGGAAGNAGDAIRNMGSVGKAGFGGAVAGGMLLASALEKVGEVALQAAAAVVKLGAQAAFALGEAVIGAAAFVEKSELAFKSLLKGSGNATLQLEKVVKLATELGLPVEDTVKSFQKLLAMQFKPAMAEQIIKMGSDLKAVGADSEQVQRAITAITQIKAKGKLQSEELVGQLAEAGVSTELVLKALGKQLGKTDAQVRKLLESGKITADQGIAAIGEAIKEKVGEKEFGEKGKELATSTLEGMVNVFKAKGSALLLDMGKRILGPLKDAITPIAKDLMKALESPEAKAVIDGVVAGFTSLLGAVKTAWPIVKEFVGNFISGFKQGWKDMAPAIDALKVAFKDVDWKTVGEGVAFVATQMGRFIGVAAGLIAIGAELFAPVIGGTLILIEFFAGLPGKIEELGTELSNAATRLGNSIIDGITNAITGGTGKVTGAITTMGSAALGALGGIWKTGSPSKEFFKLGRSAPEGAQGGIESGTGGVISASAQLGGAALGAAAGAGGGGGGPITVNVSAPLSVGQSSDPKALIAEWEQTLETRLGGVFERLAIQAGA